MAKKKKKLTIAVDFDGVLHGYSRGFADGTIYDEPVPGSAAAMQTLRERGYQLYIFSTRTNKIFHKNDAQDQAKLMAEWMDRHGIVYDKIWTFGKPMADIYIDDRAVPFRGRWDETVADVAAFQVWNKPEGEAEDEG